MSGLFFNEYPYTDFHQLNLSWMVNDLQELRDTIEKFISINALKYADPIQWNITTQYEKNTIVIDPQTGTAYISVQPVPSGVSLANTDYWTVVFDLGSFVTRAAKNFTSRYEEETTTTATFATNTGEWLVWGDTLYRALVNITAGDAYVVNSNIKQITVEEIKDEIMSTMDALYTEISDRVGDLADLTTTDKTSIVNAINELVGSIGSVITIIGALTDLNTTDKTSIVNAINEVLATIPTAITNVVGQLSNLTTTDKTSVVAAINELNSTCASLSTIIGNLANLTTTDKTSVVNAINDVNASCATLLGYINDLRYQDILTSKRILLQGDSYAVEDADGSWTKDVYDQLNDITGEHVYKLATGGAGFVGHTGGYTFKTALQNYMSGTPMPITNPNTLTDIYILGGYNDISTTKADLIAAIQSYADYCASLFPRAMIHVGCIAWGTRNDNATIAKVIIPAYQEACGTRRNLVYISNSECINHNFNNINPAPDYIHPNPTGNAFIASQVLNLIKGGEIDVFWDDLELTFTPVSPYVDAGNKIRTYQHNEVTEIVINIFNIVWTNGIPGFTGQAYTGNFIQIGTISGGCVRGFYENVEFSIMLPVTAWIALVDDISTFRFCNGWLCMADGKVFFGYSYLENGAPLAGSLYQLILNPCRYTIPTIKA